MNGSNSSNSNSSKKINDNRKKKNRNITAKMSDDDRLEAKKAQARIWSEAKRETLPLSVGAVAMIASSAVNQRVPKLIGTLMDPLSSSSSSSATTHASKSSSDDTSSVGGSNSSLVVQIIWLGALGGAASFVRTYIMHSCQETIAARLRKQAFATLLTDRDLEWFQHQSSLSSSSSSTSSGSDAHNTTSSKTTNDEADEPKTTEDTSSTMSSLSPVDSGHGCTSPAAIAVVIKDDVNTVASTVTNTLVNLIRSTSSCVFGTYNMLCINPQLVGLTLVVAPVVGAIALMTRKYIKKVVAVQHEAAVQSASFMEERLNHVSMVKMSNRQQDEIEHYGTLQDEYVRLGKKTAFANGISMGVMFGLSSSALCGVLYAGRRAVIAGNMTPGQLTSFGTYSFMLALGSAGIIRAMSEYSKGIQCAVRLYRLTDSNVKAHKNDDKIASKLTTRDSNENRNNDKSSNANKSFVTKPMLKETQSLSIKDVSFSYTSFPSRKVLQNVSFRLSRGEVVVLVGKNGAGKSSIASLIAGLYTPQSGSILVDNQFTSFNYLTDCDRSDQSQLVQVVPQQPVLFDMSIVDNVKYARPNATREEVEEALKVSNCNRFVSSLDGGLNYQVGRNGCRLSGGQRQKLGLARAFLAQSSFLVLDEPSASLDAEGETAVQDLVRACRTARQGVLVITHRAKTLELADRILVLKNGSIVEEGTLHELQKKKNGELDALLPDLE